jgi:hypothetical protein
LCGCAASHGAAKRPPPMPDAPPLHTLAKPRMGDACNGCGLCCRMEVCALGVPVFGAEAPCTGLIEAGGRTWCSLVVMEPAAGPDRRIASALGIGMGCDADDD